MTTLMALCFCIMGAGVMHAQDIAPLSDAPGFAGQLVDLYREALQGTGADLPGASEKLEGAIADPTAVASQSGTLILPRNQFFDGTIFDPYDIS